SGRTRPPTAKELVNQDLDAKVAAIYQASRRMRACIVVQALRLQGEIVGAEWVAKGCGRCAEGPSW
ncbi:MAG TPA: hypothetical protein VIP51_13735, partial [Eoetvoesiella sp.]